MRLQDYFIQLPDPDEETVPTGPPGIFNPEDTLPPDLIKADPNRTHVTGGIVNGQPISYWERMARQVIVDMLIRTAQSIDATSIAGKLARDRLLDIAHKEDPQLAEDTIRAIDDWMDTSIVAKLGIV